jgi:rod shape determining protein RodA
MSFLSSTNRRGFKINIPLFFSLLLLSSIGLISLISTTILPSGEFGELDIVYKQILFLLIGILTYIAISYIDLSYLKHWQFLLTIYILTLLLLVITLLFAPTINFVKRWLVIGGIQIQPSEIAKVTVILFTSVILSKKDSFNEWFLFFLSFLLTIPFVILIYLEPDASMAFLTLVIWFLVAFLGLSDPIRNTILLTIVACFASPFLLSSITGNLLWYILLIPGIVLSVFAFYSNKPWKNLVVIVALIGLILGIFSSTIWSSLLKDYQKDRIVAFFEPTGRESDIGFNVNQSRIAIGSGKIFGKGFGNGTQSKRNFLPEHQTDFIFASFAEEFGLLGSLFLIAVYGYIILFCFLTAVNIVDEPMLSLISLGVGVKLLFEVFINIGTNTGAIPATGIPLPLMSAGGSITIMTYLSLAFVGNIAFNTSNLNKLKQRNIVDIYEN